MSADIVHLDEPPAVSAELRAKILSDPQVAKMAAELKMPLDRFVNTIGYYMNNPGTEPAFLVVSDENLRKMGVTPPTIEQLEADVKASVEAFNIGQGPSGFDAPRKSMVELPSQGGEVVQAEPDRALEDAVRKARFPKKG